MLGVVTVQMAGSSRLQCTISTGTFLAEARPMSVLHMNGTDALALTPEKAGENCQVTLQDANNPSDSHNAFVGQPHFLPMLLLHHVIRFRVCYH
eukprot:3967360-Amphidinium_carterae.1